MHVGQFAPRRGAKTVNLITLDFETFYDRDFTLSKLTTEEYIRDPRFEVIGVGVKVNDEPTEWASGTHEEIGDWLSSFGMGNCMVLAHNTMFDGAILSWVFDIHPKMLLDTMCMSRALFGVEVSSSLAAVAERLDVGVKGIEVLNAFGKRRADFTAAELSRYGDYCINDVELTYKAFHRMIKVHPPVSHTNFPSTELRIIDLTLKMFTEPRLMIDEVALSAHLTEVVERKDKLLQECGVEKEELMSNQKFADALRTLGVPPPLKTSPLTGKETYAFAKNDEAFLRLTEHPDWRVQGLVAARLGLKSTLEETRTQRFLEIAKRGPLPVPLRYYAAHTGRFGGDDKINMQNLPSRGENAGKIKKGIIAPPGYSVIDADSSQIEARMLAWLSGQDDLLETFAQGKDVYKKMASAIYNKPEDEISKPERFMGKTAVLGCGYGMGAIKFQAQLKTYGVEVSLDEARRIVEVYRQTNYAVTALWRQAQMALVSISRWDDGKVPLGRDGVLEVATLHSAIRLPNGLYLRYDDLKFTEGEKGPEFSYRTRKGRTRIYGGKVIENICQALARCLIAEQMLRVAKRYKVVLTVHDAVACIAPDDEVAQAQAYIEECMRWTPEWAHGLPVNCESGVGKSYGDC